MSTSIFRAPFLKILCHVVPEFLFNFRCSCMGCFSFSHSKKCFHPTHEFKSNMLQIGSILQHIGLFISKIQFHNLVPKQHFLYSQRSKRENNYCHSPTPIQPNSTQHEVGVTRLLVSNPPTLPHPTPQQTFRQLRDNLGS